MHKENRKSEKFPRGGHTVLVAGFIHKSVNGVNKVLLARRAASKKYLPNKLEMPGGHVLHGDDIKARLAEELKKELGVMVNVGDAFYSYTYKNVARGSNALKIVYLCALKDPKAKIVLNPECHSEAGWFSCEEIESIKSEISDTDKKEIDQKWLALTKGFETLNTKTKS